MGNVINQSHNWVLISITLFTVLGQTTLIGFSPAGSSETGTYSSKNNDFLISIRSSDENNSKGFWLTDFKVLFQ